MFSVPARVLFQACRSKIGWPREARVSKTLKGPTTAGMPGVAGKPKAARLICSIDSDVRVVKCGNKSLRARRRAPRAERVSWSPSTNPRLYFRARFNASSIDKGKIAAVFSPEGMLPRNGLVVEVCPGTRIVVDEVEFASDAAG